MRLLQRELLLKLYDEADSAIVALPLVARRKLWALLVSFLWLLGAFAIANRLWTFSA
jgi:hypothetical protein